MTIGRKGAWWYGSLRLRKKGESRKKGKKFFTEGVKNASNLPGELKSGKGRR